jgi:hypothetical protein
VIARIRSLGALDYQRRDLHQSSYHTSRKIRPCPLSLVVDHLLHLFFFLSSFFLCDLTEPLNSSLSSLCLSSDILASFDGVLSSYLFPEDSSFSPVTNFFLECSPDITLSCLIPIERRLEGVNRRNLKIINFKHELRPGVRIRNE